MRTNPLELADHPRHRNWDRALADQICDLAAEHFVLQVLGERRAYDRDVTGMPLVYQTYINGRTRGDDAVEVPYSSDAGIASLVRSFFNYQRALGNDVIVWRTLPYTDKISRRLYFRCAFTQFSALRAQPMEKSDVAA